MYCDEYETVHVYEETVDRTLATYLSHLHGIVPALRTGPQFDIDRYAAIGSSLWPKFLYGQWRAIAPVWPVARTRGGTTSYRIGNAPSPG